jgi:hypothetical protein
MAAPPIGSRSAASSNWYPGLPTYGRGYLLAGVRAGLIVLVLLAIFAFIVLF